MNTGTAAADRGLALPRVTAALCGILILALVLPFVVVRTFHQRRLERADRQLQEIASDLSADLASSRSGVPPGTHVLAGTGQRPVVTDDGWNGATVFPFARAATDPGPDPWGNAYLVNLADRQHAWVISAGPDGILQTPFLAADGPVADDRAAPVR